ncbi:hypothetical protein SAMN02745126_06344 [Enhydrobacter aerosaccus]|uniref:Uncharacterized protein n=1 Tax=Enhydrobacter aerosaccus TaxID=225324 RepID=A0A1T4TIT9_9HYPH|nr:hypothetical protein [Enhydrobacter aerosaccus]SKA40395.1 hypothetical protein SAMN02745126_06344 [Enhydrobacter aerosaccus]
MTRNVVKQAFMLLLASIFMAVVAWPTAYRYGWGTAILGLEVAPAGQELQAVGTFIREKASIWWIAANSHPPQSVAEWILLVALSAFAAFALLIVIAKVALVALAAAFAFGAGVGVLASGRAPLADRQHALRRLAQLLRLQARFWLSEILLVIAGVVALEAAALALRVHS